MNINFDSGRPEVALEALSTALEAPGDLAVRLDLTGVSYLSPRSIGALGQACALARAAGRDLVVVGVDPVVYKSLHIAGFAHLVSRAEQA